MGEGLGFSQDGGRFEGDGWNLATQGSLLFQGNHIQLVELDSYAEETRLSLHSTVRTGPESYQSPAGSLTSDKRGSQKKSKRGN